MARPETAATGRSQVTLAGGGPTWSELYRSAAAALGDDREARWMVEEVSGVSFGRARARAPEAARTRLESMVERRRGGEPLQYVLGSWSFRRLDLMVDRRVLIPRPETEQVVTVALAELDRLRATAPAGKRLTAVDLGTGSGAIALSLAQERTGVDVWGIDASPDALEVARANLAGLAGRAATRVRIQLGDWWSALPAALRGGVDLAVSNPPYISGAEMTGLDPVVRDWEPRAALEAGPKGTEAVAAILGGAGGWMAPGAVAVIEIAPHQAVDVVALAAGAGFGDVTVEADLAGLPRVLVARWGRR